MHWKELESEIRLNNWSQAFRNFDCLSVLFALENLAHGCRVYMLRSCLEELNSHVSSNSNEVGGLLVGRVYQDIIRPLDAGGALTVLTKAVPSSTFRNSSVSLEMGTELWSQASEYIDSEKIIVGWYHSHPHLGAFFSGTDRRTQRAFFNNHYSLGVVIVPFREEKKIFCGGNSEEYTHSILVVDKDWEA